MYVCVGRVGGKFGVKNKFYNTKGRVPKTCG